MLLWKESKPPKKTLPTKSTPQNTTNTWIPQTNSKCVFLLPANFTRTLYKSFYRMTRWQKYGKVYLQNQGELIMYIQNQNCKLGLSFWWSLKIIPIHSRIFLGWYKMQKYVFHIWAAAWQNQQNGLCGQQSAWASAQSDPSPRCPHEEILGPQLPTERMPRLSWDFTGRTSFCWFCRAVALLTLFRETGNSMWTWGHFVQTLLFVLDQRDTWKT